MTTVEEMLKQMPDRRSWESCRMVMSSQTADDIADAWPDKDDMEMSKRTLRLFAGIPVFLDNAMPRGTWRLLKSTGEVVAIIGQAEVTTRWRVSYTFGGAHFTTQAQDEAEADRHVADLAANRHITAVKQTHETHTFSGGWRIPALKAARMCGCIGGAWCCAQRDACDHTSCCVRDPDQNGALSNG